MVAAAVQVLERQTLGLVDVQLLGRFPPWIHVVGHLLRVGIGYTDYYLYTCWYHSLLVIRNGLHKHDDSSHFFADL